MSITPFPITIDSAVPWIVIVQLEF
jgi:hypothetical protein